MSMAFREEWESARQTRPRLPVSFHLKPLEALHSGEHGRLGVHWEGFPHWGLHLASGCWKLLIRQCLKGCDALLTAEQIANSVGPWHPLQAAPLELQEPTEQALRLRRQGGSWCCWVWAAVSDLDMTGHSLAWPIQIH